MLIVPLAPNENEDWGGRECNLVIALGDKYTMEFPFQPPLFRSFTDYIESNFFQNTGNGCHNNVFV